MENEKQREHQFENQPELNVRACGLDVMVLCALANPARLRFESACIICEAAFRSPVAGADEVHKPKLLDELLRVGLSSSMLNAALCTSMFRCE